MGPTAKKKWEIQVKSGGHTQINNDLLEAMIGAKLASQEVRCVLLIMRKTYGWNKDKDKLALSQFATALKVDRKSAHRALRSLVKMKVVTVYQTVDSQVKTYKVNTNLHEWQLSTKKTTVYQNVDGLSTKRETDCLPNRRLQKKLLKETLKTKKESTYVPKKKTKGNKLEKGKKETTRKAIEVGEVKEVFDYWNLKKIITHRNITSFIGVINAKLKDYSIQEIKEAIDNYRAVLDSSECFMSYSWTLREFFQRSNGFEKFLTENKPLDNYKTFEKKKPLNNAELALERLKAKAKANKERNKQENDRRPI